MIVNAFSSPLAKRLTEQLEEFETQFRYPLGPDNYFSISHGKEYLPFFMAMGAARLLVAEHNGKIVGTMVLVRRPMRIQSSDSCDVHHSLKSIDAHYICDLKISPTARSTSALARILQVAEEVVRSSESHMCYSVVMAGTTSQPVSYTGRRNIPKFEAAGEIAIVRFLSASGSDSADVMEASPDLFNNTCERLSRQGIQPASCDSALRSIIPVERFVHRDGTAAGYLEDTRRGKRLIQASGEEIVSSHLSNLRASDPGAAADLIRFAFGRSMSLGFPAMFCSMPNSVWNPLQPKLQGLTYHQTTATVYAFGCPNGMNWWIDTSEI
jgi:hypothetical protein